MANIFLILISLEACAFVPLCLLLQRTETWGREEERKRPISFSGSFLALLLTRAEWRTVECTCNLKPNAEPGRWKLS